MALAVLTALAVYNTIAARTRDRSEVSNQIANLGRGSGDLARQLAEFGRRLTSMETKVELVLERALATAQPLAAEIEELSTLVKQLAESVAQHDAALGSDRGPGAAPAAFAASGPVGPTLPAKTFDPATAAAAAPVERKIAAFSGLDRDGIIAAIGSAIDGSKIDLYLQPIVTLPQRKVRYYEAMSRLKAENGDVVPAGDFLSYAEAGALLPKLDNLSVLRCVQVARRLLAQEPRHRLVLQSVRCDADGRRLSAIPRIRRRKPRDCARLVFEFTQSAVRAMGPIEHESLAALAERGFRFSMDNLTDLRVEPRELTERGFRFIKVPATLLLNRVGAASTDIHPADFSDLLGRFGIDLIAERIESEGAVVDLLDYDVRFGQGYLFSPPRPVRAEALQGVVASGRRPEPSLPTADPQKPTLSARRAVGSPSSPAPAARALEIIRMMQPADRRLLRCRDGFVRRGDVGKYRACARRAICTAGARLRRAVLRRLGCRSQRRCRLCASLRGADAVSHRGGTVILLTNAPRPGAAVVRILDRFGVPRDAYDAITSSGDVTRSIVDAGAARAFFISARNAICRSSPALTSRSRRSRRPTTWCAPACSTTRRKRRTAIATCSRRCARARCSWSAPIPTSSSSAARLWSIAPARWRTLTPRSAARCSTAASRMRRSTKRRWPSRGVARR